MTFARATLVALACMALQSMAVAAATAPDPAVLRAALADPLESNFVEAEVGTQGTLEGPFDANAYVDYFRGSGSSEADLQRGLEYLKRDGFVGGYGRQWYRPRSSDLMGEIVMVFSANSGATSSLQASKLRYGQDSTFQSFVDSGLGKDSFAATLDGYGYRWTVIIFVKGNDMFAVSRASQVDYRTETAVAQARRAYDTAPASIRVPGQSRSVTGAAAASRLALTLALILLLMGGAIVSLVVVLRPADRPRSTGPRQAPPQP